MSEEIPTPAAPTLETAQNNDSASAPPATTASEVPPEERTFGMLTHLAALAGLIGIPFANIIGPLIVWLIKKDTMPFADEQGKESLNFQITVTIALLCCIPLFLIIIGFLLMPAIGLAALIFVIIAAIKTSNGEHYRYPLSLRLIK